MILHIKLTTRPLRLQVRGIKKNSGTVAVKSDVCAREVEALYPRFCLRFIHILQPLWESRRQSFTFSSTLKMEAIRSSKTSMDFYHNTGRHRPEVTDVRTSDPRNY
jgi:hypothetical protein